MKHNSCSNALAKIRGDEANPHLRGMARFYQSCKGVIIEAEVFGLPESETGFFAFHIHAGGDCAGDGFPGTEGHYNPNMTVHPIHAGDLPPLLGNHGKAYMKVFSDRFRLEDIIGRSVIIHSEADDFHTQPSGNAGAKIACGVIRRVQIPL